ncbi:MAG: glycosyltransferase family 39 protein [Saprospiraceae bacterium]|nr:glycosyltransferase family 39 protein [Saprospiraceae bacterium]
MTRKRTKAARAKQSNTRWYESDLPYVVLAVVVGMLILASRIHFLPIPLDRDEGAYGYLGWMALSGGTPYVDFYEMKPPLLFYSYAAIVALFGKTPAGLHLAALLIHVFNAWMVYRLGTRVWERTGGVIAAMVFLIFGMNMQAAGFALQSEHVVLAYALPGLYLTLVGMQDRHRRRLFWGGLLLAASALVKQSGIFLCAAGVVLVVLYALPLRNWEIRRLGKTVLAFVAGAFVPLVVCGLLLAVAGALDAFWYWIYEHPASYVTDRADAGLDQLIFFWRGISERHWTWLGLAAAGLLALPAVRGVDWRLKAFLLVFLVLSFLTIVPGNRYYGHYWLLCFPSWCLLVPGCIIALRNLLRSRSGTRKLVWLPLVLLTAATAWHFSGLWRYYFNTELDTVMKLAYRDNYFPEHQIVGDFLRDQLQPGDQLMVLGSEPQIYLYARRKSPSRHFYLTFTSKELPEARRWEDEVIQTISTSKPDYLAFIYEPYSWMFKATSPRKLYNWAHALARTKYETVGHMDLVKGLHTNHLITGPQAMTHSPATPHYIKIYKRTTQ